MFFLLRQNQNLLGVFWPVPAKNEYSQGIWIASWQKIGISCHKMPRPAGESVLAGGKSGITGGLVTRAGGLVGPPAG